jgi:hypothetical protein
MIAGSFEAYHKHYTFVITRLHLLNRLYKIAEKFILLIITIL